MTPLIDPIAFELGPFVVRWYALAYIAGILGVWGLIRFLILHRGDLFYDRTPPLNSEQLSDFVTWATLGIILGGRLGYVLFYKPAYYFAHPFDIVKIWHGGMSFHGGLIGVALVTYLFASRAKISFLPFMDCVALGAPIGLFFGRIANFINGELWGRVVDSSERVPWAMVFVDAGPELRHPSQLYQAGLEGIVLFGVLLIAVLGLRALRVPGRVTGLFLTGYGLARLIGEVFREPDRHLGYLYTFPHAEAVLPGLTLGMGLSLPLIVVGCWLVFVNGGRT